jgi:hypothetical protein
MLDALAPDPVTENNLCSMSHPPPKKPRPWGFQPGKSGNPGGKPRLDPDLRAAAKQYTMRSLEVLVDVMENGKKDSDRVAAANAILDRGHGKATQHIEVGDNSSLVDLLVMIGSGKTIDGDAIDVTPTDATPTDATPTDATPTDITPTDVQKPDDPQLGGE